jgi:peroxiredoxin
MEIQQKVNELSTGLSSEERAAKTNVIINDIESHKEMARKLILQNPRSAAAYFAIYQKVNNTYLFSPYNKADKPYCAAVATSYNAFMPEYDRSKNLYSLVMDAIKTERKTKDKEEWNKIVEESGTGYIDIALNDKNNAVRKLSEQEGMVVLIDFSAYESKESVDYTFQLRELYNKYHSRGFEIYQISLDRNKLTWEESIENIPWVCVRDEAGPNTNYVATYNISSIPTTFLMNRKGELVARDLSYPDLVRAIEKDL